MMDVSLGAAVRGAMLGGAVGAAGTWVDRKMAPTRQIPVWTGAVGDTALTLIQVVSGTYQYYQLFTVMPGESHSVGTYWQYPDALAAVAQGTQYLQQGGTVRQWLTQPLPPNVLA